VNIVTGLNIIFKITEYEKNNTHKTPKNFNHFMLTSRQARQDLGKMVNIVRYVGYSWDWLWIIHSANVLFLIIEGKS
jgi:hypothetical protein